MKKLLLLLLISNFAFSQTGVEIRLVDRNVGTPSCNYFFNDWLCNTTNDPGLNTILSNYGVHYFRQPEGHPYPPYQGRFLSLTGTYPAQFLTDLQAYSTVVASAKITVNGEFSDALNITLANAAIGIPTGTSGNVVVTNDTGLNQIFQTFNVFYYALTYSSASNQWPDFQKYYSLACNCDAALLKIALDSHASVTSSGLAHGAILSNPQFEKPKAVIAPNPFSDNFTIETEQNITNYLITDIAGKTVVSTSSKSDLDHQASQLSAGIYILNLGFENGQKANYKLVKK